MSGVAGVAFLLFFYSVFVLHFFGFFVLFLFSFFFFFFLTSGLIFECENPTYAPVMIICWIDNFFWGGTVIS